MRSISKFGLAKMCGWFGITRQAYYANQNQTIQSALETCIIIKEVKSIRNNHPAMGGRKLYAKLKQQLRLHQVKIGRDTFFKLLKANNLLIRKRKRLPKTTNSFHSYRKYPNLIRGYRPTQPNEVWASDITYWRFKDRHLYLSFITDLYSKKIVGYQLGETLDARHSLKALRNALRDNDDIIPRIHHSDRGTQYCCADYTDELFKNQITVSMTESGDPLENAVAERVNGIIKTEYLSFYKPKTIAQAKKMLRRAVELYNQDRPHLSIEYNTPEFVHASAIETKRIWKSYYNKNEPVQLY